MLTSSANQYLRPEYITPLPTTLDTKKSPLALLAQTCSQIGLDPPLNKALLNEKSKSSKSSSDQASREKNSPSAPNSTSSSSSSESIKSSFKPYDSCLPLREKQTTPDDLHNNSSHQQRAVSRSRTPGKRCGSNQSASSTGRAQTPQSRKTGTPTSDNSAHARESPASRHPATEHGSRVSSASGLPNTEHTSSMYRLSESSPSYTNPSSALTTTTPSAAYLASSYMPPFAMDALTNSFLSQQQALKAGLGAHPYLNYTRMKTPSGGETIVPVCRDPYCTGCQFGAQLLGNPPPTSKAPAVSSASGQCPAGCAQCDHKPYTSYHAHLAALAAASQMPYACNWITADATYCGKRFSNPDELLQHIRTHTSSSDSNAAATAAALSLLAPPGMGPATHPLLSRGYPTPPLSPLTQARYHPYSKPSGILPPGLSSLGLPFPPPHPAAAAAGLPPYFSPYALYANSRLGAASGMHP